MKRFPATVLAAAALTVSASAAEMDVTVQAVDTEEMTLTLEDGTVIEVVENVSLDGVEAGVKLRITTDVANAVTAIEIIE